MMIVQSFHPTNALHSEQSSLVQQRAVLMHRNFNTQVLLATPSATLPGLKGERFTKYSRSSNAAFKVLKCSKQAHSTHISVSTTLQLQQLQARLHCCP